MDGRLARTNGDEAGDYVVPNVLSPMDLVSGPDNMDETVLSSSNFETFGLYFSKKINKISPFVLLFFLVLGSSQWLKRFGPPLIIRNALFYILASKSNVTLSQALRLNSLQSFTWKSLSGDRRFYLYTRK